MKKIMAIMLAILLCIISVSCGHTHTMSERILEEKTCTVDGKMEYYCTECDYSYTEVIKASHEYGKEIIVEPTCIQKGEAKFTCKICGDTYTEELPMASHDYKDNYCTVCGIKKVGEIETPFTPITLDYGAEYGTELYIRSTCRITDVTAEMNSYGVMTVYFTGVKTYDVSGESTNGPCSFLMVIYDSSGDIVYSDQIMTHCVVNQTFDIYTTPTAFFDTSEDYEIELKDYIL